MQFHLKKYRQIFGVLFLSVYLSFILVGTLHYHPYDLVKKTEYTDQTTTNRTTGLSSGFFRICSLHQFSQTIDNFHYSSSDIIQSLSLLESNLFQNQISNFSAEEYSQTSPRAPPLFL